jgi:homoserine dehydrogenase
MAFFIAIERRTIMSHTSASTASTPGRPITVAIAGFGTVGQSVARILCGERSDTLRLTHVCNRNVERKRVDWVPAGVVWTERFEDLLAPNAGIDVIVELVGGVEPATAWIRAALEQGTSVVTANKQVIAQCGPALQELAATHRCALAFEAAVAGGIPIIRGLREGLAGDRLVRVLGILNGTCNYILTRMESDNVPFAAALVEAQALGYAEADPTADVDGLDAQAKIAILSAVALGRQIDADEIPLQSIRSVDPIDFVYARRLECTIRQIARAELVGDDNGRVFASVQPSLVPLSSSLARVEGSRNVVVVEGVFGGETAFSGYGAGGDPTAVSVVSDLEAIRSGRGMSTGPDGRPASGGVEREFVASHYVRFTVVDRPGIIAALADVFSRNGVNVDSVLQEPGWSKRELPFVVTLESCGSEAVARALTEVESFSFHVRPPVWMPVLTRGEPRS